MHGKEIAACGCLLVPVDRSLLARKQLEKRSRGVIIQRGRWRMPKQRVAPLFFVPSDSLSIIVVHQLSSPALSSPPPSPRPLPPVFASLLVPAGSLYSSLVLYDFFRLLPKSIPRSPTVAVQTRRSSIQHHPPRSPCPSVVAERSALHTCSCSPLRLWGLLPGAPTPSWSDLMLVELADHWVR